jgi:hypothetical protein
MATIAPGKHRRPGPKMEAPAGMPFSLSEYLQAPVDVPDPAIDDSGTWPHYHDRSLAQEPHMLAPLVPGTDAAEEAARLRVVILSLSERLSEMSAYVTQNLESPGDPATMRPRAIVPAQTAVIAPRRRGTEPGAPAAAPPRPPGRPGQADSRTGSAKRPQKRRRQYQAMRIATCASAVLLVFALVSGATEIGLRGFKFFVFRSGGTGETAGSETDQQFLARQAHAALHVEAPKGRHVIRQHEVRKR